MKFTESSNSSTARPEDNGSHNTGPGSDLMNPTRQRTGALAIALWSAVALAAAGCSQKPEANAGTIRIAVSSSALAAGVTEVIVTVGPGTGLPGFTPFSVSLSQVQGTWSGYITNIPAGTQRTFDVVANDASHLKLQSGSGKADVVSGTSAMVVVNLGSSVPSNPFGNKAPVIDYVSASQTSVLPGGTVRLSISAHDPDPLDTVAILWSAACGTIDAPAASVVTWTAPTTTGPCQITAKASDNRGASVSVFLSLDVAAATSGDVLVEVKDGGNASPVIVTMTADVQYRSPVQGSLSVQATDPNGDTLAYAWSSNCATVTFATPAAATTTFTNSDGSKSCVVTVDVTDGKGGKVTGDVTLPPNILFNLAPVITHTVQPSVDLADPRLAQPVSPGDAVLLSVEAKDPENLNLTFTWTTNAGTLDGQVDLPVPTATPAPHVTTSPGKSVILFHVGTTIPADAKVTVTVRDPGNEATSHDYNFKAATGTGPCAGQANGTTCDDGNPCTTTSSCQGGVCVGSNPVVCSAPAACKQPGVCQTSGPSAGTCTYADSATGTACDDGRACTSPDTCAAGVCMSGPSTCTGGQTCSTAGVCVPGACVPACTGKTCGPDGCGGTCGTCTGTNVCSAAGVCGPQACVPACTGKTCGSDGCGGTCAPGCTGSSTCDATGQCVTGATKVTPTLVHALRLTPPAAIAVDPGGNTFVAGTISVITDVDFQTRPPPAPAINLKSLGGYDIFLARYDAAGDITWAVTVQDNNPGAITDQSANLVALTQNGRVVAGGKIGGSVTFGTTTATAANPVPYIGAFNTADGARLWVAAYDLGPNGQFSSLSAHPTHTANRIAACGFADAAATQLVSGAAYGGAQDLVIGAWSSDGALAWSKQVGGAFNETCSAVGVDANGDVVATGLFDGATLALGGNCPVLTGPGTASRKFMWVARFSGATGACTQAVAYSGTVGAANPRTLAIAPNGNLVVGGSFTGQLNIGANMTSTGSDDGFIAMLDVASLAPVWNAVRVGGTSLDMVKSVATTSAGDIVAIGIFSGSSVSFRTANGFDTTGAASLTSAGGADAFVLKLSGATGATHGAAGYGNAGTQSGDFVTVNRAGGADQIRFTFTSPGTINFGGPIYTSAGANDVALVYANLQ
jgi:hypothetical protein